MKQQYKRVQINPYNIPTQCNECGGNMEYTGLGEYTCEKCHAILYDNYGIVRNYVEEHRGATTAEIAAKTGVNQRQISDMVREGRFEVTEDSKTFLKCYGCGRPIRAGRYCPTCLQLQEARERREEEKKQKKQMTGYSTEVPKGEKGAKRFERGWD
ncbi:hypothetical protein D7X88_15620 [bacterium C-53]|nr:hypothetical protein [Lachnospiraceae bacterium]NBI04390.1 hypothetical protein [Lachnospiraceae bacterium]RKJ08286.1 hypothetical protein D7X88_15620 [bacterium C-53]